MAFRLGMTLLLMGAASLYFPLNRMLTGGVSLEIPLDAWVPLWPGWVIPYLLCPPIWVGCFFWAAWKMEARLFRSFVSAGLFVFLTAALFFYIFPTYVQRPDLLATSWTAKVLQMVYQNDGAYNAFPSGHVYQTVFICLFYNRLYPNHKWLLSAVVLVVICSTLFTHQHYLLDPLGGIVIALLGYSFGMVLFPREKYLSKNSAT